MQSQFLTIVLVVFIRMPSEQRNENFYSKPVMMNLVVYSATKPITQRPFSSPRNALKLTYSNVEVKKLSGGNTSGLPFKGEGKRLGPLRQILATPLVAPPVLSQFSTCLILFITNN